MSDAVEREWTISGKRVATTPAQVLTGDLRLRTVVAGPDLREDESIPVVPKSTLLAAQRRVEEAEDALKAMLARAGTERDAAKRLAERLEARWAAYGAGGVRREGELERAWEKAESERDALAGALRAIQAEWFEDGTLSNKIDAALTANPQASDG